MVGIDIETTENYADKKYDKEKRKSKENDEGIGFEASPSDSDS
jgi:hypothetical protein